MTRQPDHAEFDVTGMTCAACAARIEKVLSRVPGVERAQVNLALERAIIDYAGDEPAALAAAPHTHIATVYGTEAAEGFDEAIHFEHSVAIPCGERSGRSGVRAHERHGPGSPQTQDSRMRRDLSRRRPRQK